MLKTSLLLTLVCSSLETCFAADVPSKPTVCVALQRPPQSDHSAKKLLVREVVRQAFLLTAREEFGAATRDEVLSEPVEDIGLDVRTFEIAIDIPDDGKVKFELRAARNGGAVLPWRAEFQATGEELLLTAVSQADGWSHGEFQKFLKEAGLPEAEATRAVTDTLPEEIHSLELVSLTSQLRLFHSALRKDPESLTLLTALAERYALLGSVCEPHWGSEHKVFKARALLYAERAVRLGPQDAGAAWSRALVRTLVGLNAQALTEITRASELAAEEDSPPWRRPLVAAAGWDDDALSGCVAEELPLAAFLDLRNQELVGSEDRRAAAYQAMLQVDPLCFRASLAASNESGLSLRRLYGERQIPLFAQKLPELLKEIEPTQREFQEALQKLRSSPAVQDPIVNSRALVAAMKDVRGDVGEPSLAVTAGLIDSLQFMQAVRLIHTNRFYLGVDVSGMIDPLRGLFATSELRDWFRLYDYDTGYAQREYAKLAPVIQRSEPSQSAFETLDDFKWLQISSQEQVIGAARRTRDDVLGDLLAKLNDNLSEDEQAGALAVLQRLAPECPAVIAATIMRDWPRAQAHAEEWERKTDSPAVLTALAAQYYTQKKVDAEERCLLRLRMIDPSHVSSSRLAQFYLRHEREEQWKTVVTDSLELPSHGLENSNANWELASWHMRRGEWKTARPFALASAEAYSARGLHVAADCLEALEEWDESEKYIKATSERYDNDWLSWYLWCRRTGHGDIKAARKLATDSAAAAVNGGRLNRSEKLDLAVLYQLEGDLRGAAKLHRELFQDDGNDYHALMTILLLDELKDSAGRDLLIREVCSYAQQTSASLFCEQLRRALVDDSSLSQAEFDLSVAFESSEGEPTNSAYFAGRILQLRGRESDARHWLQQAASSPLRHKRTCTLAAVQLIDSGAPLSPIRGTEIETVHQPALKLIQKGHAARETDTLAAESFYHQAIELDPKWPITLLSGAAGSAGCGHLDQSLQLYSKLVELVPGQPLVLCSRAKIREALHDNRGAIADYEEALASSPSYRIAHNNLGWLRSAASEADLRNAEQALLHARRSIEVSVTQDADGLVLWAAAYAEQGNFDEAVRLIEAAIAKGTYGNRGQLEEWLKSYQQQQPYHRKADSGSPGSLFSNG